MSRTRSHSSTLSASSLEDLQHFVLEGASWTFYEQLLREIGNRPIRVTYDDGWLEIISPAPERQVASRIFCTLVSEIALATDTPMSMLGSITFRWKMKRKGLEPDESFYV